MADIAVHDVLDALGLHAADDALPTPGGMSGSAVLTAVTDRGESVIVKVTALSETAEALRARRELEVCAVLARALPLPVPHLVAAAETDTWIAIAIARHQTPAAAHEWSDDQWCELASLLGTMHRCIPASSVRFATVDPPPPEPPADTRGFARQLWSGAGDVGRLDTVLRSIPSLRETALQGPVSFVHGDCHLQNVVRTEHGRPLLVDWQSAHIGPSAGDIAFALTRASALAPALPRDRIIDAYSHAAGTDPASTRRRVTAHQLLILVEQYPEYAPFLAPEDVERLRHAFDVLLGEWTTGR